jgi:hypothetical protein
MCHQKCTEQRETRTEHTKEETVKLHWSVETRSKVSESPGPRQKDSKRDKETHYAENNKSKRYVDRERDRYSRYRERQKGK